MANVAHSTLTGSNLHENKGVSSATAGQVATADGAGNTVWTKLTASNLQTTGNPFGAQLFHTREQQTAGTSSNGSYTSGAFRTLVLNTTVTNEISGASLASNQVSLPAGTYYVKGIRIYNGMNGSVRARIRNITDGTTLVVGLNHQGTSYFNSASGSNPAIGLGEVKVEGRFTIAGTKTIEFQMRVPNTQSSIAASSYDSEVEVYGELYIWKIA